MRDISNADKHRAIPIIASVVWSTGVMSDHPLSGDEGVAIWGRNGPFSHGDPFARIPAGTDGKIRFEPQYAFEVALGEPGPAYGTPLMSLWPGSSLLQQMYNCARWDMLPALAGFFPKTDNPFAR